MSEREQIESSDDKDSILPADVWAGRKAMEAEYGWSLSDDAARTFLRAVRRSARLRSESSDTPASGCVSAGGGEQ